MSRQGNGDSNVTTSHILYVHLGLLAQPPTYQIVPRHLYECATRRPFGHFLCPPRDRGCKRRPALSDRETDYSGKFFLLWRYNLEFWKGGVASREFTGRANLLQSWEEVFGEVIKYPIARLPRTDDVHASISIWIQWP